MRTSRFDEVVAGRHRRPRDKGFSLVEVAAAAAVVTGVVASGGVLVSSLSDDDERVHVAGLFAEAEPVAAAVEKAVCSGTKGNVSFKVDALVHALGAEGGTVRSEAAESKVVARPAKGNRCTKKVTLSMGENYAFEGALSYGDWVVDIALSGATKSVKLAVDGPAETVPTQLLNGDCGGTASIAVKTVTENAVVGRTGALPGTMVSARRVPDGECAIPAESSFTTGAGGAFAGTIGYGDWMFTVSGPAGALGEFVTVGKHTDDVVLVQAVGLLGE